MLNLPTRKLKQQRKILTATTGAHRLAIANALSFPAENYHKHKLKATETLVFLEKLVKHVHYGSAFIANG